MNFPIPFTKMSGTGNDFIIIDHRDPFLDEAEMPAFARAVCERKFSVGADGLILIEDSAAADFGWRFFNGDGSSAEMCGNGARCAARFAYANKIASGTMRFSTLAGVIEAQVLSGRDGEDAVKIRMTPPTDIMLQQPIGIDGGEKIVHCINTGVPHAVLFMNDNATSPVFEWGRSVRYHELFKPAGSNVNFAERLSADELHVRTYERGVEGETMACGTGAVASAVVGGLLGYVEAPVRVTTSGGEHLIIHFALSDQAGQSVTEVFLEGPAHFIYEGRLDAEALRNYASD